MTRGDGPEWPSAALIDSLRRELGGRSSTVGLVLGSGLGRIADGLQDPWIGRSEEIPGYPASTVPGHRGRLLLGGMAGRDVWVVQGRVHLYEGYTEEETTRITRLLYTLGVRTLVLTNAAGSVEAGIGPGEIVLASDTLNLFFRPLTRSRTETASPARPWRRREPLVDPVLVRLVQEVACEAGIALRTGVLVGSLGPSYETAAEVALWRRLGGSVASMSTVPEALEARELGMRCLLFSLVTNYGTGLSATPLTHAEVVERADEAGVRLAALLLVLVPRL
jgi:purine-nucleoside phosphorylase